MRDEDDAGDRRKWKGMKEEGNEGKMILVIDENGRELREDDGEG